MMCLHAATCPAPNASRADIDRAGIRRLTIGGTRQDVRDQQLRAVSFDRPGEPKPAQDRAALRTLHKRYPVETLAEALAEGIQTGHPTMPEFQLEPDQIHDLLTYLKSLE